MIQTVKIRCPACLEMVDILILLREVDKKRFFVCDSCKETEKDLSIEQLLLVGHQSGLDHAASELRKFQRRMAEPPIPPER
jgi:heterodisulfide reductase subunit C